MFKRVKHAILATSVLGLMALPSMAGAVDIEATEICPAPGAAPEILENYLYSDDGVGRALGLGKQYQVMLLDSDKQVASNRGTVDCSVRYAQMEDFT